MIPQPGAAMLVLVGDTVYREIAFLRHGTAHISNDQAACLSSAYRGDDGTYKYFCSSLSLVLLVLRTDEGPHLLGDSSVVRHSKLQISYVKV